MQALAETVLEFDGKGSKFGKWDCCQFVNAYNKRLNGQDLAKQFKYSSERAALKIISKHGGITGLLTELLGAPVAKQMGLAPGDIVLTTITDQGKTWGKTKRLTSGSERNHTYVRRPLHAHPDFVALWADGHGRKPSLSKLYFADKQGVVRCLPGKMDAEFVTPKPLIETR